MDPNEKFFTDAFDHTDHPYDSLIKENKDTPLLADEIAKEPLPHDVKDDDDYFDDDDEGGFILFTGQTY
ncbi:MAG: hypothetical protein QMB63_05210 [Clostridiaceae bacterium]